ncbi:MAG TPA: hypothetical protein VHF06_20930 [Pseudonocardiaceae bacterium]|nr:hypothetical protein [Pseudonocardiaceae bacterium]
MNESAIVGTVLTTLIRIVAEDDACLTVRSYDPLRRCLALDLSRRPGSGPDAALIREFVVEVLCCHGIRLDELIVEEAG